MIKRRACPAFGTMGIVHATHCGVPLRRLVLLAICDCDCDSDSDSDSDSDGPGFGLGDSRIVN